MISQILNDYFLRKIGIGNRILVRHPCEDKYFKKHIRLMSSILRMVNIMHSIDHNKIQLTTVQIVDLIFVLHK